MIGEPRLVGSHSHGREANLTVAGYIEVVLFNT